MRIILNEILQKKQKSQYWLANETGIAASTINRLCNGKTTSIQFFVLEKICTALDCNVEDILINDAAFEKRIELYASRLIPEKKDDSQ